MAADSSIDVTVWMPVFVTDWLTGTATFQMSNRQRGAFFQLLAHAWKQRASLPDDLGLLARYADESVEWLRSPEGAPVLEQWPVDPSDGRRRNPRQVEIYAECVARAQRRRAAAVTGANARWGRRNPGGGTPDGETNSAPNFADAIGAFPTVVAFASASPDYLAVLQRALLRVLEHVGAESVPGFVGEVNAALQGMYGPPASPGAVALAIADWCDNCAEVNKRVLRGYLKGDRDAARRAPRPVTSIAAAGGRVAWKFDA